MCAVSSLDPSYHTTIQIDLTFLPSAALLFIYFYFWPHLLLPLAQTPFSFEVRLDDKTLMLFFICPPLSLAVHLEE